MLTVCGAGGIFLILFLVEAQCGTSLAALSVIPLIALFLLLYVPFASKEYRARRRMRRQQEAKEERGQADVSRE
jgi:hypothetical protein